MANVTINILTGEVETDPAFVAPSFPTDEKLEVSETQFIRACVRGGIITALEGEAYLARGELPAMMLMALDSLAEPERTDARLKAIGSSSFSRNDDVFTALVGSGVVTNENLDGLFRLAGTL